MVLKKKTRFKPLYKQFIRLRENIQNHKKLLKFKKDKWKKLIKNYERKLKWYKKFKLKDQNQFLISQYPNKGFSYNKRYKNTLLETKKFKLFYGNFSKKTLKKFIKLTFNQKFKNSKHTFFHFFESRLDTILYRSKFAISIRAARQLILHNNIRINKDLVRTKSYLLKPGDLIKIDIKSFNSIMKNAEYFEILPIPPKYLMINYKIMQIIFNTLNNKNYSLNFFYFNLEKIILNYYRH